MIGNDIVLIEWVDSISAGHWECLEGVEPLLPCTCYSVGFLLVDNEDYKTIALGLSATQVLNRLSIPAGCIKSIKKLCVKEEHGSS